MISKQKILKLFGIATILLSLVTILNASIEQNNESSVNVTLQGNKILTVNLQNYKIEQQQIPIYALEERLIEVCVNYDDNNLICNETIWVLGNVTVITGYTTQNTTTLTPLNGYDWVKRFAIEIKVTPTKNILLNDKDFVGKNGKSYGNLQKLEKWGWVKRNITTQKTRWIDENTTELYNETSETNTYEVVETLPVGNFTRIKIQNKYDRSIAIPVIQNVKQNISDNGTEKEITNATIVGYNTLTDTVVEWLPFTQKNSLLVQDQPYYLRFEYDCNTAPYCSFDVQPDFFGETIASWAWVNSSFSYCRNITVGGGANGYIPANVSHQINITNDTHMLSDLSDVRFFEGGCSAPNTTLGALNAFNASINANASMLYVKTQLENISLISMYYANASATTPYWSFNNTFLLGENFDGTSYDTTKFYVSVGTGTQDTQRGQLNMSGLDRILRTASNTTLWGRNSSVIAKYYTTASSYTLGWNIGTTPTVYWGFSAGGCGSYEALGDTATSTCATTTTNMSTTNMNIFTISWFNNTTITNVSIKRNNSLLISIANGSVVQNYSGIYDWGGGEDFVDWIAMANYIYPEPTYTFSVEETSAPTHGTPLLNSTWGQTNTSSVFASAKTNLSSFNQTTISPVGYNVTNIYTWYKNGVKNATMPNPYYDVGSNNTTQGLVLYLPFNNDTLDYALGNDGTQINGTNCSGVVGRIGGACSFDGTNDYISLSSGISFASTVQRSISLWIDADGALQDKFLINFRSGASDYLAIKTQDNLLTVSISSNANSYSRSFTDTSKWHHVAVTWNGTNITLYIDTLKATYAPSYATSGSVNANYIGAQTDGNQYWPGKIDEIAVWNRTLNLSEIYQLYWGGVTGGNVLNSSLLTAGDNWTAEITPCDYLMCGTPVNSTSLYTEYSPQVGWGSPTPPNATQINVSSVLINVSANNTSIPISVITLDWNGSNVTLLNSSGGAICINVSNYAFICSNTSNSFSINISNLTTAQWNYTAWVNDTTDVRNSTFQSLNITLEGDLDVVSFGQFNTTSYKNPIWIGFNVTNNTNNILSTINFVNNYSSYVLAFTNFELSSNVSGTDYLLVNLSNQTEAASTWTYRNGVLNVTLPLQNYTFLHRVAKPTLLINSSAMQNNSSESTNSAQYLFKNITLNQTTNINYTVNISSEITTQTNYTVTNASDLMTINNGSNTSYTFNYSGNDINFFSKKITHVRDNNLYQWVVNYTTNVTDGFEKINITYNIPTDTDTGTFFIYYCNSTNVNGCLLTSSNNWTAFTVDSGLASYTPKFETSVNHTGYASEAKAGTYLFTWNASATPGGGPGGGGGGGGGGQFITCNSNETLIGGVCFPISSIIKGAIRETQELPTDVMDTAGKIFGPIIDFLKTDFPMPFFAWPIRGGWFAVAAFSGLALMTSSSKNVFIPVISLIMAGYITIIFRLIL